MESVPTLDVRDLSYSIPGRQLLNSLQFFMSAGESVAIMGPSGSGKSTLLNCLAGITLPSGGRVSIEGKDVTTLTVSQRAKFRLRHIGVVFQSGELLPELTVLENVAIPLQLQGRKARDAAQTARDMLARLDVAGHADKHPVALSGGEVQRVGIARALAHSPAVALADEPTGAVDEANAAMIADLLISSARDLGAAAVIATHDANVAERADRNFELRSGRLVNATEALLLTTAEA